MALMSSIGRALFASLFVMGGIMKLQQFDINNGGEVMSIVAPKLDTALLAVQEHIPQLKLEIVKPFYPQLLLVAVLLELVGGALFIFNSTLGAVMLLAFMVGVTPVMHAFWNIEEDAMKQQEIIQFMKNVMITGALMFYLGMKPKA